MSGTMQMVYVEDDALSREVMEVLMRTHFPEVALKILADSSDFMNDVEALPEMPEMFLLDIHVVPLDGFAMLRLLRDDIRYERAKVLAVTASVMNQEVVQLRSAGFNGAIAKPLDFDEFARLIGGALNGKEVWYVT